MRTVLQFLHARRKKIFFVLAFLALSIFIATANQILKNAHEATTAYVSVGHFPAYPALDLKNKTKEQIAQIKRGEYLAKAGDCIACHTTTSRQPKPFAGGLPMQTPFGVIYSPNITSDKETGIGTWTDQQFITAVRQGISPTGYYYFPAFPYLYFNKISTPDLLALRAYLNAIPPVNLQNTENSMIFPFSWRFMQLGWRILFFYPYRSLPYQNDPAHSVSWNRGAYLVQGLSHCGMCHTPSHYLLNPAVSLGAPVHKYYLTGGIVSGYLAPNITKSNLGVIPDKELLKVFTQDRMIGGSPVQGPMSEVVNDSLKHLSTTDLQGIVEYLKSVQSHLPPPPDVRSTHVGRSIYNNYCSGCHQSGLGGATRMGDAASWRTLSQSGMQKLYSVAINGAGNMPAKGTCITCSNAEIKYAVNYMVMRSLLNQKEATGRLPTLLSGKAAYQAYCSSCHTKQHNPAPQLGDKKAWQTIEDQGFLNAYINIISGKKGHPRKGGCETCTDREIISALKYLMQEGGQDKNYDLW